MKYGYATTWKGLPDCSQAVHTGAMCCQTHVPAYVYKGSLLVQAETEAFRCRCPCLGCPRRATGEDQLCDVCRDPAAVASSGMSPWGRAAVDSEGFFYEAGYSRYGYAPFEIQASEPLKWGPAPLRDDWEPKPPLEESLRLPPGGQERVARMIREAVAEELPAGSCPVVNGVAVPRRWDPALGSLRLGEYRRLLREAAGPPGG